MFADDILLYTSSGDIQAFIRLPEKIISYLIPWLAGVGFSISPGKSQMTIFFNSNNKLEYFDLMIENTTILPQMHIFILHIVQQEIFLHG